MNSREFAFLLYCARSQPDAGSIKNLIREGIDWRTVLELAQQHGVRPMLLQSLRAVCWDAVPQTTKIELEHFNRANVRRNLFFTAELVRLVRLFQQHGIAIATFKGAVLAQSVYGDLSLREFSDLDVMVQEADVCKAEDRLTACGYQADFPDRSYRTAFLSYHGQYAFRHPQTGISVDLHWRLSSKGVAFPLHSAEVWSRLDQVTIAGRTVPTFAHEDLALFLAAHGTKEGWRSLRWICDFAELLRKYQDIDWVAVLERANRSHSSRPLLLGIILASILLGACPPVELVNGARSNSAVISLAEEAQLRMVRPAPEGELWEFLNGLNTHDRLRHRLWPIVTLLTTRTVGDYDAMPLPKSLWGIYYLTRPFRLAGKALKSGEPGWGWRRIRSGT